ncbi:hypothetical protein HYH03_008644 [Edaphochlamys debaryana]|uniref:Uncharacterized protein n=1 Tax=Edaphochlamys debaryana TaxID=47281 RepID=A0A836BZB3_9CHLO|nr:hypothetical protein HYH03_008644 [Edaphochlamys debaryana]|eukprot:KAG2493228.1 hypothetical protein HYH03_008644 [Edaphochlamys debaryana]
MPPAPCPQRAARAHTNPSTCSSSAGTSSRCPPASSSPLPPTRLLGWTGPNPHRAALLPRAVGGGGEASPASTSTATTEPGAGGGGGGGSKEALLARIARAKKYKQGGAGEDAGSPSPAAAPPTPGIKEAPLPTLGPAKVDWGAMVGFLDAPVAAERGQGPPGWAPGADVSPEAAAAAEEAAAAAEEAARAERERRFMADTDSKDYMAMLMNSSRSAGAGSATRAADAIAGVLAEGAGQGGEGGEGGEEGSGAISPDQRMEEFTQAKEARLKALGAEIITRDLSYNPGGNVVTRVSMPGAGIMAGPEAVAEAEVRAAAARRAEAEAERLEREREAREAAEVEAARARAELAAAAEAAAAGLSGADGETEVYKPKVTTWGVFPRPKDISEAYGGGRNIKPGQELETPTQKAEREKKYAAALAAFKARAGLEVDPEVEERAGQIYEEGMALFMDGRLQSSYEKFEKVIVMVPVKTKYGGLATLQKAIVLDSVGRSEEAQKLYKTIAGHAVAQVSRKAKQMLFSFEAMEFMKADQFSYAVKKDDYDKYFRPIADRNSIYVATEEERAADEAAARAASWVALAVILAPVVAVAALAAGR